MTMTREELEEAKEWLRIDQRQGVGARNQATMSRLLRTIDQLIVTLEAAQATPAIDLDSIRAEERAKGAAEERESWAERCDRVVVHCRHMAGLLKDAPEGVAESWLNGAMHTAAFANSLRANDNSVGLVTLDIAVQWSNRSQSPMVARPSSPAQEPAVPVSAVAGAPKEGRVFAEGIRIRMGRITGSTFSTPKALPVLTNQACHAQSDGDCYWAECPQVTDYRALCIHAVGCICDDDELADCPKHPRAPTPAHAAEAKPVRLRLLM